jgi:hypothetical protein
VVYVRKELILSAGRCKYSQILELSGLGSKDILKTSKLTRKSNSRALAKMFKSIFYAVSEHGN